MTNECHDPHFREGRLVGSLTHPQMYQLAQTTSQSAADFTQGMCLCELAEEHSHKLIPAGETFGVAFGLMFANDAGEIAAQTRTLIADAFDDKCGLIVSPTASPYIRGAGEECFGKYKAMIDTVLGWTG